MPKQTREISPFLTTFRDNSKEKSVELLINGSTKEITNKLPKKILPEITNTYGIPLQTTGKFAKQKQHIIGLKKKENSFFIFNTNNNTSMNNEKEKKEISQFFKDRSPIAKNSYYEEISFDMSLNVNLEQESFVNNNSNNLSVLAQSHLNKHIENIDEDIEGLADIFHNKLIKEKVLKGFKQNLEREKEILLVIPIFMH